MLIFALSVLTDLLDDLVFDRMQIDVGRFAIHRWIYKDLIRLFAMCLLIKSTAWVAWPSNQLVTLSLVSKGTEQLL